MPPYTLSEPDVFAFIVIPLWLVVAFVAAVVAAWRSSGARDRGVRAGVMAAVGVCVWLALTWQAASSGVLQRWEQTPPPFALLVVSIVAISVLLTHGSVGRRLATQIPLWGLVGVQGFRLPLELAMHRLSTRGIMPQQMSYSGLNFDILTGIGALLVAPLLLMGVAGRRTVMVWNIAGSLLLINVVTVAILSTPRIRYFGPDRLSSFVTYAPFVWLPAVMVLAALLGHLLIFRALLPGAAIGKPSAQRSEAPARSL
jgi:hypothetical protein